MNKTCHKTFTEIQKEIISKYNIDLCDGSKCQSDWSRTHAHIKIRRVCKWKAANSFVSTFTLLHEVGHIENNDGKMRRCEQEYYATIWAIEKCKEYGLKIPQAAIDEYQEYIDMELARGLCRGGNGYDVQKLRLKTDYGTNTREQEN